MPALYPIKRATRDISSETAVESSFITKNIDWNDQPIAQKSSSSAVTSELLSKPELNALDSPLSASDGIMRALKQVLGEGHRGKVFHYLSTTDDLQGQHFLVAFQKQSSHVPESYMQKLFSLMKSLNIPVTIEFYNAVITGFKDDPRKVEFYYLELFSLGLKPNAATFNAVIECYLLKENVYKVITLLELKLRSDIEPSAISLLHSVKIMNWVVTRTTSKNQGLLCFHLIKQYNLLIGNFGFDRLLTIFLGDCARAHEIYNYLDVDMRKDLWIIRTMLRCSQYSRDWEKAQEFAERILNSKERAMFLIDHAFVISAFIEKYELAKIYYKRMILAGFTPNLSVLDSMLKSSQYARDFGAAQRYYMECPSIEKSATLPSNMLLNASRLSHSLSSSMSIFMSIESKDITTFNTILNIIGKSLNKNRFRFLEKLLKEMQDDNIIPDIATCNILIDAYTRLRYFDAAKRVWSSLLANSNLEFNGQIFINQGLSISNTTVAVILDNTQHNYRFTKAPSLEVELEDIWNIAQRVRSILNANTLTSYIEALIVMGKAGKAVDLFIKACHRRPIPLKSIRPDMKTQANCLAMLKSHGFVNDLQRMEKFVSESDAEDLPSKYI